MERIGGYGIVRGVEDPAIFVLKYPVAELGIDDAVRARRRLGGLVDLCIAA